MNTNGTDYANVNFFFKTHFPQGIQVLYLELAML